MLFISAQGDTLILHLRLPLTEGFMLYEIIKVSVFHKLESNSLSKIKWDFNVFLKFYRLIYWHIFAHAHFCHRDACVYTFATSLL